MSISIIILILFVILGVAVFFVKDDKDDKPTPAPTSPATPAPVGTPNPGCSEFGEPCIVDDDCCFPRIPGLSCIDNVCSNG